MTSTSPLSPRVRPVIRLFVSSTFSDMRLERDALQRDVFPKLEKLCSRSGFQFQAIDLRWGVSSEAGLDHRTMRICFDELRRAQEISPKPNFLILLGNRYGWRPLPEEISATEFQALERAAGDLPTTMDRSPITVLREWYRQDENAVPPVYLFQSRRQRLLDEKDYTQDEPWREVQAVLWDIINRAVPPHHLEGRFCEVLEANSPPPIVRFQSSATEQEIWQGALRVPDAQEHVLAFFRQIENVGEFSNPARIRGFVDLDPLGNLDTAISAEQERLKDELRKRLSPENLFETKTARLLLKDDSQGVSAADVTTNHLPQLCHDVETRMTQIILEQIDAYWHQSAEDSTERAARELKIEQDEHARFGRERGGADTFVGRESERQLIRDYLQDASRLPLVLHGSSGCGKTALLARAAEELEASADNQPSTIHPQPLVRFIGVTPRSSDLRSLLTSLCQELRLRHLHEGEPPTDIKALREEFQEQLRSATPEQRIVLFLDALDQLSDADGGRLLNWLPLGALPDNVKLVVSCLSDRAEGDPVGQPYAELRRRNFPEKNFLNLDALSEKEARRLLFERWLPHASRTLSPDQRKHIEQRLASPACRQPIYLKLLFEEARLWPSYEPLRDLGGDMPALLAELFARLSLPANHGPLLVNRVLGYLAASRHGLAENEILEILFRDPEYKQALVDASKETLHDLPASATRIPIALWSRLRFDLAPYLSERSAGGASVLTFYHRQVAEWVPDHLAKTSRQTWHPHPRLADYFRDLADLKNNKTWQGENQRPFSEIAFHLQGAERWDDLCAYLTDFRCLDRRIRSGQVFAVVADQRDATTALPELNEEAKREEEQVKICTEYGEALITYADDCANGQILPLPEPPATDGAINIAVNSGEISPRADRLRAIANFITQQATLLAAFPKDFLTMAANAAEGGPLAEAAEAVHATGEPWLHRNPHPPTPPLRPQCLQTLWGHTDGVTSVSVTPDGRLAVSASVDKTLRVWDLQSGECLHTLLGHTKSVNSVSITPDGRRVVSASHDQTLRVWDLQSGVGLHILLGHTNSVASVSVTPNGRRAVSASLDTTLRVWDLLSGQCLQTLLGHTHFIDNVSVTPDSHLTVSASRDRTLRVWDLQSGQSLQTLLGHTEVVNSVSVTSDGRFVVSASRDGSLRVWSLHNGLCFKILLGHTSWVNHVSLTPDAWRRAVSASSDNTLRVWDLQSGECLHILLGHTDWVQSVTVTPDGRRAVSASKDKTLRVWDLLSGQCLFTLRGHTYWVRSVTLTPDGRRAVSIGDEHDKTLRVWDLQSGVCLHILLGHTDWVQSVTVTPDGRRAVSASRDRTLRVWDLQSGLCLQNLQGHTGWVNSVSATPDGRRVVSASEDNTLRVWDSLSGQCLAIYQVGDAVSSVSISRLGDHIVCGTDDGQIHFLTLRNFPTTALGNPLLTVSQAVDNATLPFDQEVANQLTGPKRGACGMVINVGFIALGIAGLLKWHWVPFLAYALIGIGLLGVILPPLNHVTCPACGGRALRTPRGSILCDRCDSNH